MTTKVFISQSMRGKTSAEILKERGHLIDVAKEHLGDIYVIESYLGDAPAEIKMNGDAAALWYLGESIKLLGTADVAVFSSDWESARECRIENQCAIDYGLGVIESYSDWRDDD